MLGALYYFGVAKDANFLKQVDMLAINLFHKEEALYLPAF